MPKLPRVTPKKVLSALIRVGFYVHHHTGSHVNIRHPLEHHLHIVIPMHARDLSLKTLKSIIVQAELTVAEFVKILKR